jgi:hypothetical protein
VAVTKFGSSNLFGKQKFNRFNQAADSVAAQAVLLVDYLVVAGGGGGGGGTDTVGAGGGAGGFVVLLMEQVVEVHLKHL